MALMYTTEELSEMTDKQLIAILTKIHKVESMIQNEFECR